LRHTRNNEIHLVKMLVREMILRETPLDDIISYDEAPRAGAATTWQPDVARPSIAHPKRRDASPEFAGEKYVEVARELMKSTKDNWVIVTLSDISSIIDGWDDSDVSNWVDTVRPNYPKNTIFAVAVTEPMSGDYSTPRWGVLHDLFGHSLSTNIRPSTNPGLEEAVHNVLPQELQISDDLGDFLPDILVAILLGKLTKKQALSVCVKNDGYDAECVSSWFDGTNEWLEDARRSGYITLNTW
jgi:hypothetical protein